MVLFGGRFIICVMMLGMAFWGVEVSDTYAAARATKLTKPKPKPTPTPAQLRTQFPANASNNNAASKIQKLWGTHKSKPKPGTASPTTVTGDLGAAAGGKRARSATPPTPEPALPPGFNPRPVNPADTAKFKRLEAGASEAATVRGMGRRGADVRSFEAARLAAEGRAAARVVSPPALPPGFNPRPVTSTGAAKFRALEGADEAAALGGIRGRGADVRSFEAARAAAEKTAEAKAAAAKRGARR